MEILKKITMLLSHAGLQLVVGLWVLTSVLVMVFGSPTPLKETLKNGKAYEAIREFSIEQFNIEGFSNPGQPVTENDVQKLARSAFPSEKLQEYTETIIDSFYAWLSGETDELTFTIDISEDRKEIAAGIAEEAIQQYRELPPCTNGEAPRTLEEATCIPAYIDLNTQEAELEQELLSSPQFLPETKLTEKDLADPQTGAPFAEANSSLPSQFQLLKMLPLYLGLLALILGVAVVLTASSKHHGLLVIARSLMTSGAFILFVSLVLGLLLPAISERYASDIAGQSSPPLAVLVQQILKTLSIALAKAGGVVFVLGAGSFIGTHYLKPKEDTLTTQLNKQV